jgi:hypothetical protein
MRTMIRATLLRVLGAWIAAGMLYLGSRLAVEVNPALVEQVTLAVVDTLIFFGAALLSSYGVVHKLVLPWLTRFAPWLQEE